MTDPHKLIRIYFVVFVMTGCGFSSESQSARNYYDEKAVAEAREKVAEHGWAQRRERGLEQRVEWLLEMSDQELWDFVPPVTQRRALNVAFNVGCPVHGTEVLREGGPYPWIMSRDRPFKVECPVGGEIYPTNDFVPWHHGGREGEIDTTEKYVDDGTGYIGPDDQVYHFVAHYVFWQRWRREITPALNDLRNLYLLTDDKRYARALAILLARIASDYPDSDYAGQAVHREEPPHGIRGGILDYIWENGAIVSPGATAFDAIVPVLEDPEVVDFIRTKGINDVRRHIEDNLLFELVNRITRGRDGDHENRIWGNFGMYQRSLAILSVVLDNDDPERGLTSDEMVDWIMRPGPWDEVGAIREALWNRFYRDGHGGEASPAYSAGWANSVSTVAQVLAKRDYDLYEHPKMRRLVDVWLDMAILGKWTPSIGDTGDIFGSERLGWYRNILLPAYRAAGDKRWAKALEMIGIRDNQLWENVPDDRIREDADAYGDWPIGETRLLGGYGLAIAESPSSPVGLGLYYGYAGGGHGHRDRLNIEMFAHDRPILPQHGYPTPLGSMETAPKRFLWTGNTIAQYGVTVNRKWQQTLDRGYLNLLASTPGLQAIDASAERSAYPDETSLYRRTSLLIENPAGQPYLFDIFRVAGGWEHAWSFHGPPFEEFETFGLDLGPVREEGTLAGPDVAFGEDPGDPETDLTGGFQYLFNVRKAQPPGAAWGATWAQPDDEARVRMTALPTAVTEVVLADCEPQLKPDHPETMPYLLAFNGSGSPDGVRAARSDFVAVVEPYTDEVTLGGMERLTTEGPDHAVAAWIRREGGADMVVSHLSSADRSSIRLPGNPGRPAVLDGEVAHLAIDGGEAARASILNARRFSTPWLDFEGEGRLGGTIRRVDYERNLVVLDRMIAGADALVGQTVVVGNDLHRTGFKIAGVEEIDGATALSFGGMPMFVALGQVDEAGESGIRTRTEFGQWQADGGKHVGRRIVDASRTKEFLIEGIEEDLFRIDDGDTSLEHVFSGDEESERNEFWISETGAGDRWQVPAIFSLQKRGKGETPGYRAALNAPVRVGLKLQEDPGNDWVYRDSSGEWEELPVFLEDGWMYFELSPDAIANGETVVKPEAR